MFILAKARFTFERAERPGNLEVYAAVMMIGILNNFV